MPHEDKNPNFYDIQPLSFYAPSKLDHIKTLSQVLPKMRFYVQSDHKERNARSLDYTEAVKMLRRLEDSFLPSV